MTSDTKIHENLSLKNLPNEIWKDIPDYEGYYQCSNFGRIKSLDRKIWKKTHYCPAIGKVLSQSKPQRYCCVKLSKDGYAKQFQVHQIVAMTFMNHKPFGFKLVVDHKDNNSLNNHIDNLQLITNRENSSKDNKGYTSKYIGVSWHFKRKRWRSAIYHIDKDVHLGYFTNQKEASKYYQNALKAIQEGKPIQIKRRTPKNKHKGIHQVKSGRFALTINKKHIGTYDTEEEALKVRDRILNSNK